MVCNVFTPEGPRFWKPYDQRNITDPSPPPNTSNVAAILLNYPNQSTSPLCFPLIIAPNISYHAASILLAAGFNLRDGSQTVTVPAGTPPGQYTITRESVLESNITIWISGQFFQCSPVIQEIVASNSRSLIVSCLVPGLKLGKNNSIRGHSIEQHTKNKLSIFFVTPFLLDD